MPHQRLPLSDYIKGIISGDRFVLSQAITLVESRRADDQALASRILQTIPSPSEPSLRIGITGVPGVGKSTFIESFGTFLINQQHSLAVLTIDPSSEKTKGSILGDKTRMPTLAQSPHAYIRPTATGSTLGGVAHRTREVMLLCEAAGYDVLFIETVGVGQSETEVHRISDFFLLLMLAGAGDELQGIKKGVMELADAIVINKADGDNITAAQRARRAYQNALHLFRPPESGILPQVLTCSALHQEGIPTIWSFIHEYWEATRASGYFQKKRQQQNLHWMHGLVQDYLERQFYQNSQLVQHRSLIEQKVRDGSTTPLQGAQELITLYEKKRNRQQ